MTEQSLTYALKTDDVINPSFVTKIVTDFRYCHKLTVIDSIGRLLNVLCTFNLRPVSTGQNAYKKQMLIKTN